MALQKGSQWGGGGKNPTSGAGRHGKMRGSISTSGTSRMTRSGTSKGYSKSRRGSPGGLSMGKAFARLGRR